MKQVMKELAKNKVLYLMVVPGMTFFLLFNYLPLFGIVIAFKDFNFQRGILGSAWSGLRNFAFFFQSQYAFTVTRNTIVLNFLFIAGGVVFQVGMALLLNEIGLRPFKKVSQSFMFLPYFVSWLIVEVFVYNVFQYRSGVANVLLGSIGLPKVNWYGQASYWTWILLAVSIWKWTGYGAVIYIATLAGMGEELFEAATIDGATRLQQVRYISLPLIVPTIVTLTLLAVGRIINSDFGMFYGIIGDNSVLFKTTDVIDTFVFRSLRQMGDIGMAAAVGLYQSLVGFVLILVCNRLARKYTDSGIF
jgi:putative aldouronate transport system permease protein